MKRWLPAPLLSLALLVLWLLLNQSLARRPPPDRHRGGARRCRGSLAPLRPSAGGVRGPRAALRLIGAVAVDVVRSALQVAGGVLGARRRPPRARFIVVPLDLRNVHALAALALITTIVPGTVWSELAPDRSRLLLHVFDSADDASFVAHYKARYEQPLREIFE